MCKNKKILFITGTRADFGKLKSLMNEVQNDPSFELAVFVTGMHMMSKYGLTMLEVDKSGFNSSYKYINQNENDSMDVVLAKTVLGLSDYIKEITPDLIVVHGDRVEALAGAIVGSLNNILVGHVEGGEVSGTIDELIRHSVSKLAHLHFVSNSSAKKRLLQLGELDYSIFEIGSPDLDIMTSKNLPTKTEVLKKYQLTFSKYAVLLYHPVTTALDTLEQDSENLVSAILESGGNFVVIYPNNDPGSDIILRAYRRFEGVERVKIFPSIRFEYFLTLLKNSLFMIGNSSAGVREAPFYGLPSIDIGSRQANRATAESVVSISPGKQNILDAIATICSFRFESYREFGIGNSHKLFMKVLRLEAVWQIAKQKQFVDLR